MPSLDFASGIIGGYFDQIAQERARKEQNSLQAAQFLLQTGRVRDFNDLLPFLGPLMEKSPFGQVLKKGGKAGAGGKGKGQGDPSSILSAFINPMLAQQGQGQQGQPGRAGSGVLAGPSTGATPGLPSPGAAPAPSPQPKPGGPLLSDQEALDRQMAARRAEGTVDTETSLAKTEAERKDRERFITGFNARFPESPIKGRDFQEYVATGKWPTTYRPVSLPGTIKGSDLPEGTLDIFDQPRDPTKMYRVREADGVKEYIPTVPTGAAQREYSQATQDKLSEELARMGTGKTFSTATDEERYKALESLAKRDQTTFDQNSELKYLLAESHRLANKARRDEELEGYQGAISGEPPDPAIANIPDRKLGGLTPGTAYEEALMYGTVGASVLGGRGLASKGPAKLQKDAIQNIAGARAGAIHVPLVAIQNEYQGLKAATRQVYPRMVAIEAGSQIAERNLDLTLQLSSAVDRTSMPFINDKLQRMARAWSPAIGLNAFETALYTAAREYARVTTAPASGAQLTVSAAQRIDELIKAADTPEGLAVKIATMKKDMANVRAGYSGTIRDIYQNAPSVAAFLGIRPPGVGGTGGGAGGGRIYYDANGNPVRR